jgi:hypothetical protein
LLEWLGLQVSFFPVALNLHLLLDGQVCGEAFADVVFDLPGLDGLQVLGFFSLLQEHVVDVLQVIGESLVVKVVLPIAESQGVGELVLE